jgi:hypothetical protein
MSPRKQKPASSYYQPTPQGTLTTRKPFKDMSPDEARIWVTGIRTRLQVKMQRERAYLDRRMNRGVHTPTDEAYEQDQQLEAELLAMLDEIEGGL